MFQYIFLHIAPLFQVQFLIAHGDTTIDAVLVFRTALIADFPCNTASVLLSPCGIINLTMLPGCEPFEVQVGEVLHQYLGTCIDDAAGGVELYVHSARSGENSFPWCCHGKLSHDNLMKYILRLALSNPLC